MSSSQTKLVISELDIPEIRVGQRNTLAIRSRDLGKGPETRLLAHACTLRLSGNHLHGDGEHENCVEKILEEHPSSIDVDVSQANLILRRFMCRC